MTYRELMAAVERRVGLSETEIKVRAATADRACGMYVDFEIGGSEADRERWVAEMARAFELAESEPERANEIVGRVIHECACTGSGMCGERN